MDRGSQHCTGGGDQTVPKEKKCKMAKWLSEEILKIAEKRREVKGKGEKEKGTHPNAKFQRRGWRDKRALLSEKGKEVEEINRMGNTRDWRCQGHISCKVGHNKGQKWQVPNKSIKY